MQKVELIYDSDCPNIEAAREQLRLALQQTDQHPKWKEWDRGDPSSPPRVRRFGSPTILVDGNDVAGHSPDAGGNCCRLYSSPENGLQGVPPLETVVSALRNAVRAGRELSGRRASLAVMPALGVAMLPKLACPACWPAYAGLLSAVGLGFLTQTAYLLPLTAGFLVIALAALGFRARNRRGFGPLVLGLLAAVFVIVGKFQFESDPAMYGGIALLVVASLWNTWPRRIPTPSCPACVGEKEPSSPISRKEIS